MENRFQKTGKFSLWKVIGIAFFIIGFFFAVFLMASNEEVVFESESVPWVVVSKDKAATRVGAAPGPVNYIVEIAHPEDASCTTKVSLGHLDTEEWDAIQIGDTCYYPGEIITFWDYYIMGKRPGPEDGFQISGAYAERLQWQ